MGGDGFFQMNDFKFGNIDDRSFSFDNSNNFSYAILDYKKNRSSNSD